MKASVRFSGALWFFLVAGLSVQCDDSGSAPALYSTPDDLTKVVPLQIGNYWTYLTIAFGIAGYDTTIDSIRIVDTLWMNGMKCYKYEGIPPHLFGYGDYYFEAVNQTDYCMYLCINCLSGSKTSTALDEWLPLHLLETPVSRGHQWRIADWDSTHGSSFGTLTITNADTTVQLGAGRFDHAICLSQSSDFDHRTFLIVPGIGVIRQSIGALDSWSEKELIAWSLR